MNRAYEVQHLESLESVRHRPSAFEGLASTINVLILMLGFTCIAAGYVLSNTPPEQLAEWLGRPRQAVEHAVPPPSVGELVSRVSQTWLDLLG
jgi:hypothetical protein